MDIVDAIGAAFASTAADFSAERYLNEMHRLASIPVNEFMAELMRIAVTCPLSMDRTGVMAGCARREAQRRLDVEWDRLQQGAAAVPQSRRWNPGWPDGATLSVIHTPSTESLKRLEFATVEGDCMNDWATDGDLHVIEHGRQPVKGDLVAIDYPNRPGGVVKFCVPFNGRMILASLNEAPIALRSSMKISGVVIAHMHLAKPKPRNPEADREYAAAYAVALNNGYGSDEHLRSVLAPRH